MSAAVIFFAVREWQPCSADSEPLAFIVFTERIKDAFPLSLTVAARICQGVGMCCRHIIAGVHISVLPNYPLFVLPLLRDSVRASRENREESSSRRTLMLRAALVACCYYSVCYVCGRCSRNSWKETMSIPKRCAIVSHCNIFSSIGDLRQQISRQWNLFQGMLSSWKPVTMLKKERGEEEACISPHLAAIPFLVGLCQFYNHIFTLEKCAQT